LEKIWKNLALVCCGGRRPGTLIGRLLNMGDETMTVGTIRKITLALLLTAPAFGASADPFTWDLSHASPSLAGVTITADTVTMTDFLVNGGPCPPSICASPIAPGEGYDQFIMRINGFSLNGTPVPLPGLNSAFGLYLEGSVGAHGVPSVYDQGRIAVVADPTNDDGTLSATPNGVNFSNPAGTADDVTLATGSLLFGAFGTQSNGNPGLHLQEIFAGENGFLVSPNSPDTIMDAFFFNTSTSRVTLNPPVNGVAVEVNGGIGVLDIAVPEPGTLELLATGLAGLLAVRRRAGNLGKR
jgi:hypothetical protein